MKSFIVIICLVFTSTFYGQRLYGTITDLKTEKPIAGVNVFIKSIKKGVTSKNNGVFYFEQANGVKQEDTILFNMVGYQTLSLTLREYQSQNNEIKLSQEKINTKNSSSSGKIITLGASSHKTSK
ncbi:carboxypeptidase-like regulatory domain-containing protein [Leeuwenhoekiella sp. MAR_2009_132]|uniref:carboxypeptidase-like regulatory domain-containing protein n=1 Tax=Leeuwenhoekiella sp. MAR_2009_132 TaxID=1392489 RepID=UPI00048BD4BA|nr:carboxypeptidase-like regulatory domain-containing protein [Leeuwenhoekiella sp. MAR_2009_132]